MAVLFALLLIVGVGVLFWTIRSLKTSNFPPNIFSNLSQTKSYLPKIETDTKKPNLEIALTSSELTSIAQAGFSYKELIIKNPVIMVNENEVDLYGNLTRPIGSEIKMTILPTIIDGRIFWQVTKITAGKLVLPKFVNRQFESGFSSLMDQNLQPLYESYTVTQIKMTQDRLTIIGQLKN